MKDFLNRPKLKFPILPIDKTGEISIKLVEDIEINNTGIEYIPWVNFVVSKLKPHHISLLLDYTSDDKTTTYRATIKYNYMIPKLPLNDDHIKKILSLKSETARIGLARRKDLKQRVIQRLLQDKSEKVRNTMIHNHSLGKDIFDMYLVRLPPINLSKLKIDEIIKMVEAKTVTEIGSQISISRSKWIRFESSKEQLVAIFDQLNTLKAKCMVCGLSHSFQRRGKMSICLFCYHIPYRGGDQYTELEFGASDNYSKDIYDYDKFITVNHWFDKECTQSFYVYFISQILQTRDGELLRVHATKYRRE